MKIAITLLGGLLILAGGVWFFQGIGLVPGSFMTGERRWAVYGATAFILGLALVFAAWRGRTD